jgi:hypothetical protein
VRVCNNFDMKMSGEQKTWFGERTQHPVLGEYSCQPSLGEWWVLESDHSPQKLRPEWWTALCQPSLGEWWCWRVITRLQN